MDGSELFLAFCAAMPVPGPESGDITVFDIMDECRYTWATSISRDGVSREIHSLKFADKALAMHEDAELGTIK